MMAIRDSISPEQFEKDLDLMEKVFAAAGLDFAEQGGQFLATCGTSKWRLVAMATHVFSRMGLTHPIKKASEPKEKAKTFVPAPPARPQPTPKLRAEETTRYVKVETPAPISLVEVPTEQPVKEIWGPLETSPLLDSPSADKGVQERCSATPAPSTTTTTTITTITSTGEAAKTHRQPEEVVDPTIHAPEPVRVDLEIESEDAGEVDEACLRLYEAVAGDSSSTDEGVQERPSETLASATTTIASTGEAAETHRQSEEVDDLAILAAEPVRPEPEVGSEDAGEVDEACLRLYEAIAGDSPSADEGVQERPSETLASATITIASTGEAAETHRQSEDVVDLAILAAEPVRPEPEVGSEDAGEVDEACLRLYEAVAGTAGCTRLKTVLAVRDLIAAVVEEAVTPTPPPAKAPRVKPLSKSVLKKKAQRGRRRAKALAIAEGTEAPTVPDQKDTITTTGAASTPEPLPENGIITSNNAVESDLPAIGTSEPLPEPHVITNTIVETIEDIVSDSPAATTTTTPSNSTSLPELSSTATLVEETKCTPTLPRSEKKGSGSKKEKNHRAAPRAQNSHKGRK
ncbi:hypothetical protein HDU96_001776 [Phlyctochytrium bullatum]|nr:hypothetical protein HDU96_001776 [Phlyctochytrium bullatum]